MQNHIGRPATFRLFHSVYFPGIVLLLICAFSGFTAGQSPVDRSQQLQKVEGEFELADGAAWDGNWSLYIPDVKGQKLYRYVPKTKQLTVALKDAGRISATYFQLGRLYLSDNQNQCISILKNGKKTVHHKFGSSKGKPLRPNDLVVDRNGGIYVTFTPQNQVLYISPDGKESVAVDEIKTPNGIALSPDESTLYVSSFVPKEIYQYNIVKPGETDRGSKLASLPKSEDRGADGMAMDRAGNVYCTGPTGVTIWSTEGKLLDKIITPGKPINCIFGDTDAQTLYISCFGGVYSQKMRISGKAPQPPMDENVSFPSQLKNRPSTIVPKTITAHLDTTYAQYGQRKMLMDLFVPKSSTKMPAIVVVHGGAWLKGDKTKFRALSIELAKQGFVTAAIEYRLGGEAHFPAASHDCSAAVRFLRARADRYSIDPHQIGAIGGSAGGHLVGLMASSWKYPALQGTGGHSDQSSQIGAAIVLAGPMEMITGSVAERSRSGINSNSNIWLGKTIDQAPELYRLSDAYVAINADTAPILFMTGEFDKPERNERSREKLKSLNIRTGIKVYPDGKHGCWNQNPWLGLMAADMAEFMKQELVNPVAAKK